MPAPPAATAATVAPDSGNAPRRADSSPGGGEAIPVAGAVAGAIDVAIAGCGPGSLLAGTAGTAVGG